MKTTTLSLALLLAPILLAAQNGGRGEDLYIPPDLTITLAQDMSWFARMYDADMEPTEPQEKQVHIQQERSRSNRLLPLPIVFFDQASSVVPQRYQYFHRSLDADDYREEQEIDVTYEFAGRRYAKYLEILNIIGYRMSLNDSVTVEILGGYSTEPGENAEIARERSDVVVEYLQNIWRIDPSRITILPPRRLADSSDNVLAQEEARSVRIFPSEPTMLRSVIYPTVEYQMQPMTVAIGLAPNMPRSDIASARLVIASGDDIMGETVLPIPEGDEGMPIRWTGLWFMPRQVDDVEEPLSFNLVLQTYSGGARASNTVTVPVVIDRPEEENGDSEGLSSRSSIRYDGWESEEEGYVEAADGYGRSVDLLEGSVKFFDFRDTTLSPLNRLAMRSALSRIDTLLAADNAMNWRLVAAVDGDFSENPEVEDATLRTGQSIYRNSMMFGESFFTDPDSRVSLYIFPDLPENPEEVDQMAMISDILEQMYGDRAEEMQRMQEESRRLYNGDYTLGREAPLFDSLLVARGRGFVSYLYENIDSTRIDSLIVKPAVRYSTSVEWLPEERLYSRMVTWRLYRSDNPDWEEELEREEDEYDYDYGYDDDYVEEESEAVREAREDVEEAAEEMKEVFDDDEG